jgi:hypothetical protein
MSSAAARSAVALLVLIGVSACSGLLPPVPVTDLFGVDGRLVALEATGPAAAAATTFGQSFDGVITPDGVGAPSWLTGVIAIGGVQEAVTFGPGMVVVVPGQDVRAQMGAFVITGAEGAFTVRDGDDTLGTARGAEVFASPLVLSPVSCTYDGATICTYAAAVDRDVHRVVLRMPGGAARRVLDAFVAGGRYTVAGDIAITLAAPGFTAAATITVTLVARDGSILF